MNALLLALALSAQPGSASAADEVVQRAFAAPADGHAVEAPSSSGSGGSRMFGWGLALIAVAAVTAMALKRKAQRPEAGFAEVAQNLSVGPKRSLLVVNFGGKRMLVGSTDAGFSVLAAEPLTAVNGMPVSEFDALLEKAAAPGGVS
ncbi:MAG: FliO/MopB family protein [Archangiaceae bacterium]|nr:FliO/MopB family protein [Archangiaceae bacterium]